MDPDARAYIDAIPAEHRPLFDRVHRLILEVHPDAEVVFAYRMPTYKVEMRRLYVGVWKHGVSLYGWGEGEDGGITARHPELQLREGHVADHAHGGRGHHRRRAPRPGPRRPGRLSSRCSRGPQPAVTDRSASRRAGTKIGGVGHAAGVVDVGLVDRGIGRAATRRRWRAGTTRRRAW